MTTFNALTPVAFVALMALAATPAHAQYRGNGGHSGGHSHAAVSHGGSHGVVVSHGHYGYYGHPAYYRPYYSFRPRVSVGFGLWMGYPVPYPAYAATPYGYAYPSADPYAYGAPAPSYGYPAPQSQPPSYGYPAPQSQPPSYGYPAPQSQPPANMPRGNERPGTGGISFEIAPDTAAVFVDGTYRGTAGEFGASAEPLGVSPGRHRVEVRAPGYRTMTFEADVRTAEVIPYQGALQRN